ncbi:MAG: HD family phosphohydrolase [Lachnospirales bacterium]
MSSKNSKIDFFKATLIMIALVITFLLLVLKSNVSESFNLEIGDVAPTKIKSPITTVNEYATDELKLEAENNTSAVYVIDEEKTTEMEKELDNFFLLIESKRVSYNAMIAYNSSLPEGSEPRVYNFETALEDYTATEAETLITMSTEDYSVFKSSIESVIDETLQAGIKTDEMPKTSVLVKDSLANKIDSKYVDIAYKLALSFLEPNNFIDEEITQANKDLAIENVEDVMIKEGQTIVDEGEIITLESYSLLNQLGFIEADASKVDIVEVLGYLAQCMIMLLLFLTFIVKFEIKSLESHSLCLAFFVIYLIGLLALSVITGSNYAANFSLLILLWVAVLIDFKVAFLMTIMLCIQGISLAGFTVVDVMYVLLAGFFMVSVSHQITERSKLVSTTIMLCLFNVAVTYVLNYFFTSTQVATNIFSVENRELIYVPLFATALVVCLAIGTMPLWEVMFGILTPTTLTELTKPSKPLLKRLTIEAPGTYHHSLIVANLSEAAAEKIGANFNLIRAACYYHDIGKLSNSSYFGENQNGVSMHTSLSPEESTKIIKAHVTDGIELAKKHKLPQKVMEIAFQHHGNTLVKFFYYKALENNPDAKEEDFRYTSNRPQTKEAGIIMLADTVEAAVRSMIKTLASDDELKAYISKLINDKISDGQLSECELTYKEVEVVKETFFGVFQGMYHERVVYPEKKETPKVEDATIKDKLDTTTSYDSKEKEEDVEEVTEVDDEEKSHVDEKE